MNFTIDGIESTCNFLLLMDETLNLSGISNDTEIILYPNPAKRFVHIDSPQGVVRVSIYDITGKKVLTTTANNIDVSTMNKGMYFVEINTSATSVTRRLVVEWPHFYLKN